MIDPIRFFIHTIHNVSVIRQKDKNRKQKTKITRGNKKTKLAKSSENQKFLPPDTHTYMWISGVRNVSFFGKIGVLCFVVTFVSMNMIYTIKN